MPRRHTTLLSVVHPVVRQLDLPKDPDIVASTRPKFSPSSVSEAPPERGEFEAQAAEPGLPANVATGASNVNTADNVADINETLSVTATLAPIPKRAEYDALFWHTTDVSVFQEAVWHAEEPSTAERVGFSTPKLTPSSVSCVLPEVGLFGLLSVVAYGASNENAEGPVPIKEDKVMATAELDGLAPLYGGAHSTVVCDVHCELRHKVEEIARVADGSCD